MYTSDQKNIMSVQIVQYNMEDFKLSWGVLAPKNVQYLQWQKHLI